jgi:hypothetical protein
MNHLGKGGQESYDACRVVVVWGCGGVVSCAEYVRGCGDPIAIRGGPSRRRGKRIGSRSAWSFSTLSCV